MNTDERQADLPDSATSGPNLLNEAVRFFRLVRRKLPILIISMVIGGIIGSVWYITATRKYESIAEIMVLKTEGNVLEGASNSANQRTIQDIMPTYQRLLTSDNVLIGAIARLPKEHRIDLKGIPKAKWANELKRNLTVSTTRQTTLLSVRYVSKKPETAKFVVNAIVDSYLEMMRKIHNGDSKENLDLLNQEEARLSAQLTEKEGELSTLKKNAGILLQGGDKNTHFLIQQTVKLSDALVEAQRKTLDAHALVLSVQHALETGADLQSFIQQAAGELSHEFIMREMGMGSHDTSSVTKREEELLNDKTELEARQKMYGPNHPQITQLENKIRQTEKWIEERPQVVAAATRLIRERELGPRLLGMVRQRLYQASQHEAGIRQEFEMVYAQAIGLNDKMTQIEILEMGLKRLRDFYQYILEKIAKVDIGANSGLKISVTTPARVSLGPVAPKILTTVILCIVLGALTGMGIIYVIDALDDRFRSPDELQWQLQLPTLAMIREMDPLPGSGLDTVITFCKPNSLESESFRTLRSSITFSNMETRRLVVTSTEPGDGKTTTLANLAVAFAQSKKKTLLIDADLRRPGMTQLLELKGPRGLSSILRDSRPLTECCLENIFNLGVENLDVMPSGPRPTNPAELLGSERFNDLIAWAEAIYDQILIDAPPVLAVSDPAIIGRVVDGAVVVVRPDKNRRKMVLRAIESYRVTGVNVVGIVANHVATDGSSDYGDGYGYGYGYGYGHTEEPEVDNAEIAEQAEPAEETRIAA